MYKKIEDRPDLIKDLSSRAILNINNDGLATYKAQKNKNKKMTSRLDNLEQDIKEIKQMLLILSKGINK